MIQVAVEDIEIPPGRIYEWRLVSLRADGSPALEGQRSGAGYNQVKHFTVAQHAHRVRSPIRSYVAGTFDISGPVDLDALESSVLHLVRRHEVLRSVYHPSADDLACDVLRPGEVALERTDAGTFSSCDTVRRHLHETFKKVDTLSWPLIVMGAVVRDDSATVFFSCDHLVTDGLSTAIAVNDIAGAYAEFSGNRRPVAPDAGSYLEFSRHQRRQNREMRAEDERLDYWRDFVARSGGFFPRFPLDLGVEPGRLYPSVTETETLLDALGVEALEARCREAGGRVSMGLLAALAIAVREEGGPEIYRGLVPVNERGSGKYAGSVGWFINTLPVEFPVERGRSFSGVMAAAQEACARMKMHGDVHFVKAWSLLAPVEYSTIRYWPYAVNFFSYTDFRRTPGAEHDAVRRPKMHVWVSRCNGILFWFNRTGAGLHLNSIYVDTPQAGRTKAALVRTLKETVDGFARSRQSGPVKEPSSIGTGSSV